MSARVCVVSAAQIVEWDIHVAEIIRILLPVVLLPALAVLVPALAA
jgi:hypothetical protein